MGNTFLNKLLQRGTTTTELSAQATAAGEALVAAGMAPYEELTRSGYSFHCTTTTPTASVVALPTTTAGIGLFNSASDGGKSIIIDALYAVQDTGHGVLTQSNLICVTGQTRVAALATPLVIRRNNGNGATNDSIAIIKAGGAILDGVTGVVVGWMGIGQTSNKSVISLPGEVLWADIGGRLIVPPGRQFGLNVISSNVENTWNCGIMWHEKQLTLG